MRTITVQDVQRLLEPHQPPCISIYMSTDPRWPGGPHDRLRMKGLLRKAAERASEVLPARRVDRLLRGVIRQLDASWPPAGRAVAVLRSPEVSLTCALPVELPSLALVAPAFHTAPLVSALDRARGFLVLSLAGADARLLEGDATSLREVPRERLPPRLAESLRAAPPGGPGADAGGRRRRLRGWYRAVDEALWDRLRRHGRPLVLAGRAHQDALFRAVSRYPWLLEPGVEAGPGPLDPAALHARAWPIVEAHLAAREGRAAAEYRAEEGSGRARDHLEDVARAVAEGRVALLLHRQGAPVWGRVDPPGGEVVLRDGPRQEGDADVQEDLRERVLRAGGDVIELAPARMPTPSPVAALLRR